MNKKIPKNIDDHVDRFPKEVQQLLEKMCLTIKKAAPKAKETISYGMLTFTLDGCFQRSVSVQVFQCLFRWSGTRSDYCAERSDVGRMFSFWGFLGLG